MGKRRIRIANLPPEVPEETLRAALAAYGEIITIHDEIWSKTHRYTVANGVKVFMMKLTKHLPSHMTIAGYRILTSYDGQPITCYGCGDTEHMFQVCPKRRGGVEKHPIHPPPRGPTSLLMDHTTVVAPKRDGRRQPLTTYPLTRQGNVKRRKLNQWAYPPLRLTLRRKATIRHRDDKCQCHGTLRNPPRACGHQWPTPRRGHGSWNGDIERKSSCVDWAKLALESSGRNRH